MCSLPHWVALPTHGPPRGPQQGLGEGVRLHGAPQADSPCGQVAAASFQPPPLSSGAHFWPCIYLAWAARPGTSHLDPWAPWLASCHLFPLPVTQPQPFPGPQSSPAQKKGKETKPVVIKEYTRWGAVLSTLHKVTHLNLSTTPCCSCCPHCTDGASEVGRDYVICLGPGGGEVAATDLEPRLTAVSIP